MSEIKAMLYALTSMHSNQTEEPFNKWYDEVHAPSRARCPGVNHVVRFTAVDNQQPQWVAIYELSDLSALQTPEYKKARENDGDDESVRFDILDRRVYKIISDKKRDDYDSYCSEGGKRDMTHVALQPAKSSPVTDEEFNSWYEDEHVPLLAKATGWLRSFRLELIDARDMRKANTPEGNTPNVARYLACHEWENGEVAQGSENFKVAVTTPWRTKIMDNLEDKVTERRRFKLWKQF
jgi:hypothetical protein